MGKAWGSSEQQKWLEAKLPEYLKAQGSSKLGRFLTVTQEEWFKAFSEREFCFPNKPADLFLTEDENAVLAAVVKKRKNQIKDWLSNHAKKVTTSMGGPRTRQNAAIMKALNVEVSKNNKAERAPHKIEVYLKLFVDKVDAAYLAEVPRLEASTGIKLAAGALLQLQRNIVAQLHLTNTAENRQKVNDYLDKWRVEHEESLKTAVDEDPTFITPTPEAYQRSIDAMPGFLLTVFNALAQTSGWSFVVLAGGPVPKDGGKVFVEDYHFGAKSVAGNDFRAAHADFEKEITKPFCNHVLNCFGPDIRASQAIITPSTARGFDAEETLALDTQDQIDNNRQAHNDIDAVSDDSEPAPVNHLSDADSFPIPADPESSTPINHKTSALAPLPNLAHQGSNISHRSPQYVFPPISTSQSISFGPDAPGGPMEHISAGFSHMGMLPHAPTQLNSVHQDTPSTSTHVIDPQLIHQSETQAVNIGQAFQNSISTSGTNTQQVLTGRKRKQAEAQVIEEAIAHRRPRREIQAPPRADRDVEVVMKGSGKKKAKKP